MRADVNTNANQKKKPTAKDAIDPFSPNLSFLAIMLPVGGTGTHQCPTTNRVDSIHTFPIFPLARKAAQDKALALSNDLDDLMNSLDGDDLMELDSPVTPPAGPILITQTPTVKSSA